MLDQSFSAENFYKIFFLENRKGTFDRQLLPKDYLDIHEKVKQLFSVKNSTAKNTFEKQLENLYAEKEKALRKYLQEISERCNEKSFVFKLTDFIKDGKTIYTVKKDAPSFFAMKQLQYNIFRTFKVKQSNRYDIVKQLRILLEDGFPKYIVRIDIKGFYENIPQEKLFEKIGENQLLNFYSKKLLKRLLYDYESKKNTLIYKKEHGVPRGVGASAYLSELYMRDIDSEMKSIQDLVYYVRYVDDVVLVFIPQSQDKMADYYSKIEKIVTDHGLSLKDGSDGGISKTLRIDLFPLSINTEFDFLGYKFVIENSKLKELKLSDNKLKKYHERLEATVEEYNVNSKFNEKAARKLLIKRFKFLTGNFHLINNKKRIKSGIYYSNILLKDNEGGSNEFNNLSDLMKHYLLKLTPHAGLTVDITKLKTKILKRYNFQEGFYSREKSFHSFNDVNLREIVSAWKK